jgi:hypothetical protein
LRELGATVEHFDLFEPLTTNTSAAVVRVHSKLSLQPGLQVRSSTNVGGKMHASGIVFTLHDHRWSRRRR